MTDLSLPAPTGTPERGRLMVQADLAPGTIDLAWGHPGADLLPVDLIRDAAASALERYGPAALAYGAAAGPGPFLEWLAAYLGTIDGRAPAQDELLVTAGASHALDMVCSRLSRPGDVCLVPTPTYHLALRILGDHPLEVVPVATDGEGPDVAALAAALARARARGKRPRFVYLIPTFANPTGVTLTVKRRREIAALCESAEALIIEDDVYRELAYDAPAPPSIWSLARPGTVIRLGSFSKTLAPGLRVGYLAADAATVRRLASGGLLDSGGGINHLGALMVSELAASGAYQVHLSSLRRALSARRDALATGLRQHLPEASFATPAGGYFIWLRLPGLIDAVDLLSRAERHGTGGIAGPTFTPGGGTDKNVLRLSFSMYPPDQLAEASRRLAVTVREAPITGS